MTLRLPLELLSQWEEEIPSQTYLLQPLDGKWHAISWKEAVDQVRRMAAHLKSLNFPPGSNIAIYSKNCAHWVLADYAIWMSGHVSVPLYGNSTIETARMIIEHSEAKLVFMGKLDKPEQTKAALPAHMKAIAFPYGSPSGYPRWDDVIKSVAPLSGTVARAPSELATIIYTSGTTGIPKGVMHTFHSMSFTATNMLETLKLKKGSTFFSFLPLAHVAERVVTELFPLYLGGTVSYAESPELFAENLRETSPTVFLAVPRIWSKFQAGIYEKLPPEKFNKLLSLPLVGTLIKRKIRKALGLNSVTTAITGAAPTPPSLMQFFAKLGVHIQEAYGMTENMAYSHFNPRDQIRHGTAGRTWPHIDVKIGQGGEILVKSEATMQGYFKNVAETEAAIQGGYLKTGDVGEIDSDGFLKITGRVKEIFKTEKGEYVAPAPLEMKVAVCPLVEQVCVVGSSLLQPMALLVLTDHARKTPKDEIRTQLETFRTQMNASLTHHERLSHLIVVPENWTPENAFLTPSLKVRRAAVEKEHGKNLVAWSQSKETILFA